MKRTKITYAVCLPIIAASCIMLVYQDDVQFNGIEFGLNISQYLFSFLCFISLSLMIKNRYFCYFYDRNIVRLTKISSRRVALIKDLSIIALNVIAFDAVEFATIAAVQLIKLKSLDIHKLLMFAVYNILVKTMLMIIQYLAELITNHNNAFVAVNAVTLLLLFIGPIVYEYAQYVTGAAKNALTLINKCNLINYLSLTRKEALFGGSNLPMIIIIAIIALLITAAYIKIKKYDILAKE